MKPAASSRTSTSADESSTVTVTGNGSATARADRIVANITIDRTAREVEEVERLLADDRKAVGAALDDVAVPRERVRSHGIQVFPWHEWEKDRHVFKGFRGTETIVVRIPFEAGRSLELVRALARVLQHVRVNVDYLVRDLTTAKRRALEAAVADARQKAEIIAVASGGRLWPVPGRFVAIAADQSRPRG
ncbi:MAG: SIMPL domain-containing protein [Opitutaceae bacterium]